MQLFLSVKCPTIYFYTIFVDLQKPFGGSLCVWKIWKVYYFIPCWDKLRKISFFSFLMWLCCSQGSLGIELCMLVHGPRLLWVSGLSSPGSCFWQPGFGNVWENCAGNSQVVPCPKQDRISSWWLHRCCSELHGYFFSVFFSTMWCALTLWAPWTCPLSSLPWEMDGYLGFSIMVPLRIYSSFVREALLFSIAICLEQ